MYLYYSQQHHLKIENSYQTLSFPFSFVYEAETIEAENYFYE